MKTFHKIIFALSVLLFPLCISAQGLKTTETEVTATDRGELISKDILEKRDISLYDQGGHFDCHGWDKGPKDICDQKKVRDFIWQHWTDKKRGYIRITYGSVDARSTSHIFIEPNEKGEWYIAWRIARWHSIPGHGQRVDDILDLNAVKRFESKTHNADDWWIGIKGKDGKVVYTVPHGFK